MEPDEEDVMAVSFDAAREFALVLPGAEEGTSYGTPAFRVRKKLFLRLHDSGESLVVRIDLDERELMMKAAPKIYFITDHYTDHPMMLVSLANVQRDDLAVLIEQSWRRVAPKKLIAQLEVSAPIRTS
jgi:hypothetical protein